ncbi:phosphatidylinositol N-acetylglucosaminyltransferase subunit H-like [Argopecten irradians]|uniref:phosphatidylinositol N-acetylglucosaminyltransferase subunit H-like n=1 Tax=Argopecten irradians TaxID=31199 RepID=UPI003710AA7F
MDATYIPRSHKDVICECYGQQGKGFCIRQPPINVSYFAVILVFIHLILYSIYWFITTQSATPETNDIGGLTKIAFTALGVGMATVVTAILFGIQVQSESLVFLSSIGVNVKRRNRLGRVTAEFFEISEIKDIVILEAITMQRVVCYLAIVLKGSDNNREQLYPLFMKSSPDLGTLKVIYRDVHQLLQDSRAS